jgi:alkylation response protein AidB-like acyl-CoA dehydrogenase
VSDGSSAGVAIVLARSGGDQVSLYLVDLSAGGVSRKGMKTIDPSLDHAQLIFDKVPAELVGAEGDGWHILSQVLDNAAILMAFEQVGGADRALEMARDYALDRMAFGRQIGSFQAIKHKLADMLVDLEHARSAAYHAVWALSDGSDDPALAVSIAQALSSSALQRIAADTIQVHGGIGFTWEHQAQLYFKRAATDAALLGSAEQHRSRVADLVLDTVIAHSGAVKVATGQI